VTYLTKLIGAAACIGSTIVYKTTHPHPMRMDIPINKIRSSSNRSRNIRSRNSSDSGHDDDDDDDVERMGWYYYMLIYIVPDDDGNVMNLKVVK
jgi:hypothetical protein